VDGVAEGDEGNGPGLAAWSPWLVLTNSSGSTNLIVPIVIPAQFFRAVEE